MAIVDIILAAGSVGAIIVVSVFIFVYLLATPGKEISFWGIKFHKRPGRRWMLKHLLPLPKKIPSHWKAVLSAFIHEDQEYIREDLLYDLAKMMHGMTNMQTKAACHELVDRGLLSPSANHYALTSRSTKLVSRLQKGETENTL